MASKREELDAAFFGTPTKRAKQEGVARPKHAHDGWRDGKSHPFNWGGQVYDVIAPASNNPRAVGRASEATIAQYHRLREEIGA